MNAITAVILKPRMGQRVRACLKQLIRISRKGREGSLQTVIEKYYQWDHGVLEGTEEADKRSGTFIL